MNATTAAARQRRAAVQRRAYGLDRPWHERQWPQILDLDAWTEILRLDAELRADPVATAGLQQPLSSPLPMPPSHLRAAGCSFFAGAHP